MCHATAVQLVFERLTMLGIIVSNKVECTNIRA